MDRVSARTNFCRLIIMANREGSGLETVRSYVIYRDSEPGAIFVSESGESIRVADYYEVKFYYEIIEVGDLGEGSRAKITLTNGQIPEEGIIRNYIQVTYLCKQSRNPSQMQSGLANKKTCDICRFASAISSCKCSTNPVYLCGSCLLEHQAKNPMIPHILLPISVAGQNSDEYLRKFNDLQRKTDELRRNLQVMEQCGQEFNTSVDYIIDYLRAYRDSWLERFRTEKEKLAATIEVAIQEAHNCLIQGTYPILTLTSDLLDSQNPTLQLITPANLLDWRTFFETLIPYYNRIPIHVKHCFIMRNLKKISSCQFCKESTICYSELIVLSCDHFVHNKCLGNNLVCAATVANPTLIRCPSCDIPVAEHTLQQFLKPYQLLEYKTKLQNPQIAIKYCPKCNTEHQVYGERQGSMRCQHCEGYFCASCQSEWGSTHNSQQCLLELRQREIASLEQGMKSYHVVSQCPFCLTPYRGDSDFGYMNCARRHENDWCFQCSVNAMPILAHGAHWHRPDCKYWVSLSFQEQWRGNCPNCQYLGKCCDPPPRLTVPRRLEISPYRRESDLFGPGLSGYIQV